MLDQDQLAAARHVRGPCMVLAGPGSGKTTVIVGRLRFLLEEEKIPPEKILVITFTRAAAREMKERFLRQSGQKTTEVTFGTFHGVFFSILRQARRFTADSILKENEKTELLRGVIRRLSLDPEDEGSFLRALSDALSLRSSGGISDTIPAIPQCTKEQFLQTETAFRQEKERLGKLDFDDILSQTRVLFLEEPAVLSAWQEKFRFLMVDEFQDINPLQYELIRLLALPENNLFIVGDDDQAIYRFRGAEPAIMLGFSQDYPKTAVYPLMKNYRCQKEITALSSRLISHNEARFEKDLTAVRHGGRIPDLHVFADPSEEHRWVLERIRLLQKDGMPFKEMAVLFRTGKEAQLLMEALMHENIPFRTREALPSLYTHWVARDLFAYLELAYGSRRRRDLIRVLNRPNRFLSRELLSEETVSFSAMERMLCMQGRDPARLRELERQLAEVKKLPPYGAVNYIRRGIGYEDWLRGYAINRGLPPEEFVPVLNDLQQSAKTAATYEEWKTEIRRFSSELQKLRTENGHRTDAVTLSTLHASKGLEFRAVFLINCVRGVMPHRNACLPADLEEERRLFYVGVTRAKDLLSFCAVKKLYHHETEISPFLRECGVQGMDLVL